MYTQIVGGRIYTPSGWIDGGSVLIEGKQIKAVLNTELPVSGARLINARGSYIIPGGIETHVHGAAGADFMDGTVEAFRTAADYHLQNGTTTIYPTLSTSTYETIMKGIECTEVLLADETSSVEGLHLEGPYFSVKMAGAQLPELIRPARPEEYTKIMERGKGIIKRWDAAPEIEGTLDFGRYVKEFGIVTAIAHTEAGEPEIKAAWEHGYTLATHFYNAMKVSHKKGVYKVPGAVETILDLPDFDIEVICDGIHVPPLMVNLAYKVKGRERMALTTDALLYTGTPADFKDPTGHAIVEDGVCKLSDRSALAGSVATMDRLIRTAVQQCDIPLIDAVYMASTTPARIMGITDTKGAIEAGKDADILFLDEELQLHFVMHRGRVVRGEEYWA